MIVINKPSQVSDYLRDVDREIVADGEGVRCRCISWTASSAAFVNTTSTI